MQVTIGHSMFEHSRPALTDSFFQVGRSATAVSESMKDYFPVSSSHVRHLVYQGSITLAATGSQKVLTCAMYDAQGVCLRVGAKCDLLMPALALPAEHRHCWAVCLDRGSLLPGL